MNFDCDLRLFELTITRRSMLCSVISQLLICSVVEIIRLTRLSPGGEARKKSLPLDFEWLVDGPYGALDVQNCFLHMIYYTRLNEGRFRFGIQPTRVNKLNVSNYVAPHIFATRHLKYLQWSSTLWHLFTMVLRCHYDNTNPDLILKQNTL